MRDRQYVWRPTKYLPTGEGVTANPAVVYAGSLIAATLTGQALHSALRQYATGELIDVGCGTAPMRCTYEPLVTRFVGVDWPAGPHDSWAVQLFADAATSLPFRDNSFDTALCSDVLEHLDAPEVLAAEVARVLGPSGHLILTMPFLYPVHEAPHDYQRFTRFGLERLCERAGLQPVELVPLGGSLDVLADLTSKHLAEVPVIGRMLARMMARSALWFGETALGARFRERTRSYASLGYLLVARRRE